MYWEKELLDLYDANQDIVGKVDAEGAVLLPLLHTTAKAQVEVKIDKDGNFIEANKVLKGDDVTIIPTTFESGSRTTNNRP
ncbi:type I-C CRISPR-associated protein Cas8c/Csd1, partial [Prevotella copri]|uniref:type I-C CRISPR-associated protein Cas8c/Csd1 n=1 Tax=Segatella copri TaxID=165179 RepID=UPI001F2FA872